MILDEIAAKTIQRISERKKEVPLDEVKRAAEALPVSGEFPFENALRSEQLTFICEVKKASPSKGLIAEDFPYLEIAKEYERAGREPSPASRSHIILREAISICGKSPGKYRYRCCARISLWMNI